MVFKTDSYWIHEKGEGKVVVWWRMSSRFGGKVSDTETEKQEDYSIEELQGLIG